MKIIGLNGSPRGPKSRTKQLIEQALSSARETGAETELFDLSSLNIKPCIACDECHKIGSCIQNDDFTKTLEGILTADGLIIGSPVYNCQVTAQLKAWIDRLGMVIHCQLFSGKYGAAIATSGGSGETETADYLDFALRRTGMQCTGKMACGIDTGGLLEAGSALLDQAGYLGRQLVQAIKERKIFADQIEKQNRLKVLFAHLIRQHKENWLWEYNHWVDKGWF